MEGGEVSSRFSCVTPGVWELSFHFITIEVAEYSVCGVSVDDLANGIWFLFHWKPMLLWVMEVGFGNTCTVSVVELRLPLNEYPIGSYVYKCSIRETLA